MIARYVFYMYVLIRNFHSFCPSQNISDTFAIEFLGILHGGEGERYLM